MALLRNNESETATEVVFRAEAQRAKAVYYFYNLINRAK